MTTSSSQNEPVATDSAETPSLMTRPNTAPRSSIWMWCGSLLLVAAVAWTVLRQTHAAGDFTDQVETRLHQTWLALRTPVDVQSVGGADNTEPSPDKTLPDKPLPDNRVVMSRPILPETLQLVEAMELRVTSQTLTRTFTGILNATQSSDLGFNRTGQVKKIFVDQGDQVKKGDVLIQLDTVQLQADILVLEAQRRVEKARLDELTAGPRQQTIDAAHAKLRELEALRNQAKTTAERQAKLWKENAIARQSVDDSIQQLAASENRVVAQQQAIDELEAGTRKEQLLAQSSLLEQLDAEIASANVKLDESKILAPFDGIIAARKVVSK